MSASVAELGRERARTVLAVLAALAGFALFAASGMLTVHGALRFDALTAGLAEAITAGACVLAPWLGLLVWLVVMPLLNASRSSVYVGWLDVMSTTVVLVALAVGWYLEHRAGRAPVTRGVRWAALVVAILVVLALASTFAARELTTSTPIAVHGLIEPAIAALLLVALRPSRDRIAALLGAMALSVTVAAAYNLFRLARDQMTGVPEASRVDFARFTYYNVGIFGNMLAMAVPITIGLLLYARARRWPAWASLALLAGLAIQVVAAYLTYTKSTWLACLLGGAFVLLLVARTIQQRAAVVLMAAILSTLIVPYPSVLLRLVSASAADAYQNAVVGVQGTDRAASWDPNTKEGEVSIEERVRAAKAGIAMTVHYPILGVGPGQFAPQYEGPYHDPKATRALGSPHDLFIDLASEFGLPLAVIVAAVLAAAALLALRLFLAAGPRSRLAVALLGAVGGFVIVSVTFGVDLYRPWRYMNSDVVFASLLVAAIFALAAVPARDGESEAASPEPVAPGPARVPAASQAR